MKFWLLTLHFLMGRTEGKNGSFIAIRMRIHQKLCSFLTPSWRPEATPKFLIVMCILWCICYCFCVSGVSKNKTLNSSIISVVFFSCFKKFKYLGDALDSVTHITVCHIEVPSFGRFYNLAQILCSTAFFLLSENCGMWSNISFSMSAVPKKGSA